MIYPEDFIGKVICGDCLEVMKGIPDGSIDLILTDPPYGIDYQSAWRTDKTQWKPKIKNDKEPFVKWIYDAIRALKLDGSILCFYRWDVQDIFTQSFLASGGIIKSQIIWDKAIHGMGDLYASFAPQHESILFVAKGKFKFPNKRPHSIMKEQRVSPQKLLHPNEKPINLIRRLLESVSKEEDLILDPFIGSGTTAVACKQTNRNFIGIELEPKYCEIARKRLEECDKQLKLL